MRKLVLFGLVISLLVLGCSGGSDHPDAGDGDAGSNGDADAGDCQFDPQVDWFIVGEILITASGGETWGPIRLDPWEY